MAFRLNARKVHLTYKTHLPFQAYKDWIHSKIPDISVFSFVHEVGEEDEIDNMPYAHTHVFIQKKTGTIDTRDQHFFDYEGIHCHIATRKSGEWAKHICTQYHHGVKKHKIPKKSMPPKEPVFLYQYGCEDWKFQNDLVNEIANAPDFLSATELIDKMPSSYMDIKIIQDNSKKRKFDSPEEDSFTFKEIPWDQSKALILRGPSGIGKTNWALGQSAKAVKIDTLDALRSIPQDTELLVFDELLFDECSKAKMIALLDKRWDYTIHTRHSDAKIPKGTKRIFVCNEHEHPFGFRNETGGHESVRSRYQLIDVVANDLY